MAVNEKHFKAWLEKHNFWKLDASDWRDIYETLEANIGDAETEDLLDRIISKVAAEYGD